jgi:O-acetyl-ADP-ribose deacetylase (regulator of RNase III)
MEARIKIVSGDLTRECVDAIINAANIGLLGGGEGDGVIHRAAGPQLLEDCRGPAGCSAGEVRFSPGFGLKARRMIRAVRPVWSGGDDVIAIGPVATALATCRDIEESRRVCFSEPSGRAMARSRCRLSGPWAG